MRLVLITLIKKSLLFLKNEKSFASYEKENFARRFQVSNVILRFLITVTLDAADPDIALPIAKIELFFVYYSSQSLLPFTPLCLLFIYLFIHFFFAFHEPQPYFPFSVFPFFLFNTRIKKLNLKEGEEFSI